MTPQGRRFTLALAVFLLWCAALGGLAVVSATKPPVRIPGAATQAH